MFCLSGRVHVALLILASAASMHAQSDFSSGEITVKLVEGLDSSVNPRGISHGQVTKSTNPAITKGSPVIVGLQSDPVNGGYAAELMQVTIGGRTSPAASSAVELAPDAFGKLNELTRAKGGPKDAASGTRVFLPAQTMIRLTLTTPPAGPDRSQRQQAAAPPPPPQPKGWTIEVIPELSDAGQEVNQPAATLIGQTIMQGHTAGAYLTMHCGFPTTSYPNLLPLEVVLGGTDDIFNSPIAGRFVDVSDLASSEIGTTRAITVNAVGQNRSNGARVRFFYALEDIEQIVNGGGQVLTLTVRGSSGHIAVAKFSLPTDDAPMKQLMASCLAKSHADAQALEAETVASCPVKPGKVLQSVDLTYGDSGKSLAGDMNEIDNGGTWKLPIAAKGHVPRKTMMNCSYGDAAKPDDTAASEKATVPIPSSARSCMFDVQKNDLRNSAICLSVSSKDAAAGSSTGTATRVSASAQSKAPRGTASAAQNDASAGPTAPVNRLNVRGISVRMGRGQILAAASTAGMVVLENKPEQLKLADPGASGLILTINLTNDTAVTVNIGEKGAAHGEVFDDLCKKWGKPPVLPTGYANEMGTGNKATWGNKKDVYADFNPSIYAMGGQTVTIYDAVALAPHIAPRERVKM